MAGALAIARRGIGAEDITVYDRRGILVLGVGTINRGFVCPSLTPDERIVCALAVRPALQPGEYTLVPRSGRLMANSPDPGLLHDRLEALPPVIVTRAAREPSPFCGLAELETEIVWTPLDR